MSASRYRELTFVYANLKHPISVSIFESELYSNNLVISPMVGTLVVYYSDERPVPFLAESWQKDENQWTFFLRKGIKCENGEEITAKSMRRSLIRSLKWLSKEQEQPVFNKLRGYKEFRRTGNESLLGIRAEENRLVFDFIENFRGGFLEYLTMAPFGYISEENFLGDVWKDNKKFISSGPYRLVENSPGNHYILEKRNDWPLNQPNTPDRVIIKGGGLELLEGKTSGTIYETSNNFEKIPDGYVSVRQMPGSLMTVNLSTGRGRALDDIELRIILSEKIKENLAKADLTKFAFTPAKFFYFNQVSSLPKAIDGIDRTKRPKQPLKLLTSSSLATSAGPIVEEILKSSLNDLSWPFETVDPKDLSMASLLNSTAYDIRRTWAEIGGGFEGWIIDMLFCSEIGFKFADPSGRICALAKEYESSDLPVEEAIKRFNTYIAEDAALIPLFHIGGQYLMSSDIDTESLSSLVTRVRFDEIKFK